MRHLEGTPRSQTLLLAPSVEDYVPEDHPRHFDEDALEKANKASTRERMSRRMATVEPTFATLKRILNKGRFTCWGLRSASSDYSLGVVSYKLIRAINVLGVKGMMERLS